MADRRTTRSSAASRFAGALLVAAFLIGISCGSAQGATGYKSEGSAGQGNLSEPSRVAVDASTGDVLVVDSAASKIVVFDNGGPAATQVAEFGAGELASPYGIAIDQSSGDVYVSDAGNARIARYTRTASSPPAYSFDGTYVSPPQGSGTGQIGSFASPIAVDPSDGDLVIADTGNLDVARYDSSGTFVGSFNGEGSEGGVFTSLLDLTVDSTGHVYTVSGSLDSLFETVAEGRVEEFSSTGAPEGPLGNAPGLAHARAIAFDSNSGNVVVAAQGEEPFSGVPSLLVFNGGSLSGTYTYPQETAGSGAVGLAVGGDSSHRLYALTTMSPFAFGVTSVQVFGSFLSPDLVLDPPSEVTATGARLSGTVNPVGIPTEYWFELQQEGSSDWKVLPRRQIEGTPVPEAPVPVEEALEGLEPNFGYSVRLAAESSQASVQSPALTFSTAKAAPAVKTGAALEVTSTSAQLVGTVDPQGLQTRYFFEYGPTQAYGSLAPAGRTEVAGQGHDPVGASTEVAGLSPGGTYHYRLVAFNEVGETRGADMTLTAASGGAPRRAYELVSPPSADEKGNVPVTKYNESTMAFPDGNSVVFGTQNMSYPGSEASVFIPRNLATRSSTGWHQQSIDPPTSATKELAPFGQLYGTVALSADHSRALVISTRVLAPGAEAGPPNLFVRDLTTDSYTFIATVDKQFAREYEKLWFVGSSADLKTIVFITERELVPNAAPVSMYEWREGEGIELVSRTPDGEPFAGPTQSVISSRHDANQVSQDGKRVYVAANAGSPEGGLYLDERGSPPKLISVSHRPGDPQTPVPAEFDSATPDGHYVIFTTAGEHSAVTPPLTVDAPESGANNTYRYDAVTGELEYICSDALAGNQISSPSSGEVFFKVLEGAEWSTYAAHAGEKKLIDGPKLSGAPTEWELSPNGRFLAFVTRGVPGRPELDSTYEVFLYDSADGQLDCVSCRSDGGGPAGDATLGQANSESSLQHHFPRSVLDDGTVFFDTPEPLVPRDANGMRDVYMYKDGTPQLISGGDAGVPSTFADAMPDGSNVFFVTAEPLVKIDRDTIPDLYDARIGGGFASQEESPSVGCVGEGCRPPSSSPPPPVMSATEGVGASAGKAARRKRAKRHRHKPHTHCRRGSHIKQGRKGGARCVKNKGAHGGRGGSR